MDLPPPLAWVPSFVRSVEGATDSHLAYTLFKTVNPLVYKIRFLFSAKMSGKNVMLVWNLFQMYAAANDCMTQGKTNEESGRVLFAEIIMKRRLGLPKDEHPLG